MPIRSLRGAASLKHHGEVDHAPHLIQAIRSLRGAASLKLGRGGLASMARHPSRPLSGAASLKLGPAPLRRRAVETIGLDGSQEAVAARGPARAGAKIDGMPFERPALSASGRPATVVALASPAPRSCLRCSAAEALTFSPHRPEETRDE